MRKLISSLLAFAMVLAMFSGVMIFNTSAAPAEEVQMHIPFINQYTLDQAQKMGKANGWVAAGDNSSNASNYSFSKDDEGRTVISFTTPAELSAQWKVCTGYLSTGTSATPFVKDGLIDGINIFGDAELSNKTKIALKLNGDDNFKSAFTNSINLMLNSGTERVCLSLQGPTKSNGYLIYDFSKITRNNYDESGIALPKDAGNFHDAFDGRISTLNMAIIFNKVNTPVTFWFEDVYLIGSTDTLELHRAIREGKEAGVSAGIITAAEDVYLDENATQEQVDAATAKIDEALNELKFGYQKAKTDLDNLLNVADELGFFDSSYSHYEEINDADLVYSDANSTLTDLRIQIAIVRTLIANELIDNDEILDLVVKAANVWSYNYTAKSYQALSAALDEVSMLIYQGLSKNGGLEEALANLQTAYDALVAAPVRSTTANFFDGWTTAQVNDVVDANSAKLCDSIGAGLNINNAWNAGDFSNNTVFEADNNFSMTSTVSFAGKAMGWKNMDRSGTLAASANKGYPTMNVAGLKDADGVRFKLEADGYVQRILIGLSNCADTTREQYAIRIRPEFVDKDGYINIPFSYFQKAFWCSAFAQEELENVIVFIIEAYGVDNDTTITVSDFRGYKALENATAADAEKLAAIVEKLQDFDISGRYDELVAEAAELSIYENYTEDYDRVYDEIFAVLKDYGVPSAAIVDVPGFSIYTQEELDLMDSLDGESSLTKTERGVIYNLPKTSGDYAFVNGIYVDGTGFDLEHNGGTHKKDPFYGKTLPINGKTFIDMLGGYKLTDIIAYRYQVEDANPNKGNAIHYSDGKGLWHSMLTVKHDVKPDADNWFTYYIDETPIDESDWYYNGFDLQKVKEEAVFAVFEIFEQRGKEMYNWQVILYESIDRSALKQALTDFAELGVAGYDDALATYYDKNATAADIADAAAALIASATPDAPAAPTAAEITYNSVTLTLGPDTIEYRMGDDGEWSGQTEYTGLEPNTEYSFYARVASIGGLPASEPSKALVVKTLKAPLEGEVAIDGEAVFGATLTATATVTTANPGELTYTWFRGDDEAATGAEYVIGKDDVGSVLKVVVTSANCEGELASEPTAAVAKANPEVITTPAPVVIMIGEKLGTAALTGGEATVEGRWSWIDPELIPDLAQSGSTFPVLFTPTDAACYNTVTAYVIVNITSNTEEQTVTDDATGISLTGDFIAGSTPVMNVEEVKAGKPSYLALLRAARKSTAANNLILFKNITFTTRCYIGTLTLNAQLDPSRAGEVYTVWFFANGEVCSAEGVVGADGVIEVDGFIADIVA